MSYDLAVWEGPIPASTAEATRTFETLYERYLGEADSTPPTEGIAAYVHALLARYPDLTELDDDVIDDSPWADGPMIGNASGPIIYFGFVPSAVSGPAWPFALNTAREHGLVAFDPQTEDFAE